MTNGINWDGDLPYNHKWEKNQTSIMNPNGNKITWPQLVAEYVIWFRIRFINTYKDIKVGPEWYRPIMKPVRDLNQQATVICNYFPHPTEQEPLVAVAFKNWFRKFKPMKIGHYRKICKNGNRNITQDEKDVVLGITSELDKLYKQREVFTKSSENVVIKNQEITFDTSNKGQTKKGISSILDFEKQITKENKDV